MTLRKLLIALALFCSLGTLLPGSPPGARAGVDPETSRRGMVVSAHHLASRAGADVLRAGGNAIDAAVATGLALAVVHPTAGNLGGGGFMVIRTAKGRSTALDFRETAPRAAHAGMFLCPDGQYVPGSNHEGYRAVGVPGTVAGFDLALRRYGTLGWSELAAPAVRLADEGFPLSPTLAREFERRRSDWERYPASSRVFLKPSGETFGAGDLWRQPDLAKTLRRMQAGGRDAFYRGETARGIADDMQRHGGLITLEDLSRYRARERRPVRGSFRGLDVISMPPPSSGGIALIEMLNMLEHDDLAKLGHNSAPYLHLLAEAMRRAYADRAQHLGDPEFNPELPRLRLLSKPYATALRRTIRADRVSTSDPLRFAQAYESPETTHYSVIDAEGNAVAVTYTLEYAYGSRIVADGLGFLYNNEMGDFNPQPGRTDRQGLIGTPPNVVAPGKRMLSSMTPTILARGGQPALVLGSPGGRTIINTVLQVVLNTTVLEMQIERAVALRRVHHQWLPDELVAEQGALDSEALKQLRTMGHAVRVVGSQGSVMAIRIDPKTGIRRGAADPRQPDAAVACE
jgi:gamma-glutamyltranspeptidase/glutathione hydrolase